jgi:uncharacterized protein YbjT (DUF2867 family)
MMIVVTGAGGLNGAAVVGELARRGLPIRALVRSLTRLAVAIHPRFVSDGTLMFHEGEAAKLEHTATRTLPTGAVQITYRPLRPLTGRERSHGSPES